MSDKIAAVYNKDVAMTDEIAGVNDEIADVHNKDVAVTDEIAGVNSEIAGVNDDIADATDEVAGVHGKSVGVCVFSYQLWNIIYSLVCVAYFGAGRIYATLGYPGVTVTGTTEAGFL